MKNYLQVYYNEQSKPYTSYPFKLCQYLVDRFAIDRSGNMIDVGCGRGEFLQGFKQLGLTVNGLDIDKFQGKILDNFEIRKANLEFDRFPYDDQIFDLVFSKSVVEHLHNPENFIKECQRILKPGGRIIIMTPDWQSQRYVFYSDHTHVQPYVELGLARLLDMYGFRHINTELFYQLPWVWHRSWLKIFLQPLRFVFPVKKGQGNSLWRWSRELMLLGTAVK